MRLGLLICDHVSDAYLPWAGSYPKMFANWLADCTQEVFYVVDGQFPSSPEVCDAWLINGSRHSVYEEVPWILELKEFVKAIYASGRPCLGVCFGHQMIAEALGGRVAKSSHGWCVGVHSFSVESNQAWMIPPRASFNLLMMCQDQVQALPPDAEVLASAEACPVGMFRVGENMLGIQAHPEFSPRYDRALMESRVDRMGQEVVKAGIASLNEPIDATLFAEWVKKFMNLS